MVKEGVAHGYILDSRSFMGLQLEFGLEHFEVQAYRQKRPQNLHILDASTDIVVKLLL